MVTFRPANIPAIWSARNIRERRALPFFRNHSPGFLSVRAVDREGRAGLIPSDQADSFPRSEQTSIFLPRLSDFRETPLF
jgi:hypothetical protein